MKGRKAKRFKEGEQRFFATVQPKRYEELHEEHNVVKLFSPRASSSASARLEVLRLCD